MRFLKNCTAGQGPLLSVYPVIFCPEDLDKHPSYSYFQYSLLICDIIYGIDFFLHILHRQLTEQASKRLYKKKSGMKLILDLISLCPLFSITKLSDECPDVQFWPNILLFNNFFVIYRVVEYFCLIETHSVMKLLIGYMLILALMINCITCLVLLLTANGLCENCNNPNNSIYDWRMYVYDKFPDMREHIAFVSAAAFSLSFLLNKLVDNIKPATYSGFLISIALLIFSYSFANFIVIPKLFAEFQLRLRRICDFYLRVERIIEETKRRNADPSVYISVEKFYQLMWLKHSGIPAMPEVLMELPRNFRVAINCDLVWPVFYHSPIFRKTSQPFQRFLGQFITLEYKLPQERFFVGLHCYSNLYYIKSGIAQFISTDDASSPLLSVTGGTLFGDISFYCPPFQRKMIIHCLTYCEVYTLSRKDIIAALHIFPEDRDHVIDGVWGKVNHARTLINTKNQALSLNRSDLEDIDWIKQRWWQIHDILEFYKLLESDRNITDKIPTEHESYHCPKYIGQLVLCSDIVLKKKTLFAKTEFPWVLLPDSTFDKAWRRFMLFLICLVLILYPPSLIRRVKPLWFGYFDFAVTFFYIADILVALVTWSRKDDIPMVVLLYTNIIDRFKTRNFMLDLIATCPLESLALMTGVKDMYNILKFNRLVKIYMLFTKDIRKEYDRKYDPMDIVFYKLLLVKFGFVYVSAYFLYELQRFVPDQLRVSYLFGSTVCPHYSTGTKCDQDAKGYVHLLFAYLFELMFNEVEANSRLELIAGMCVSCVAYVVMIYIKVKFVSSLFLKYKDKTSYHYLVTSLKKHYINHRIHPDLLKRMNRHLMCHWKYFYGMDVVTPNLLKDEPKDIHWKFQGAVAEQIIGSSKTFSGANRNLVKELSNNVKFLLIPKLSSITIFGVPLRNVTWVVNGQVRCEYFGENNELKNHYMGRGHMLSLGAVFFGTGSFRSYMAATDCEIMTIPRKKFMQIIKRYPEEHNHFKNCIEEFGPPYTKRIYKEHLTKHSDYKLMLRERVFHSRNSIIQEIDGELANKRLRGIPYSIRNDPESRYTLTWMMLRAISVVASIIFITIQGGSGAKYKKYLYYCINVCRCVSLLDIILKLTVLPHYDERGLVIRSMRKRVLHYAGRGLLADVIGMLPMRAVLTAMMSGTLTDNQYFLANVAASYAHLYLITGYFDYIADRPTSKLPYYMILKWQICITLLLLGASAVFTTECIEFTWTSNGELAHMERKNGCWIPSFMDLDAQPTIQQLHDVYAQSIGLAQCGLTRMNLGMFHLDRSKIGLVLVFVMLSLIYRYIISVCLTLLVLQYRGDTLFSRGISQLRHFLEGERLDKEFIRRILHHFKYWWIRSQGVGIQLTMSERISAILKEDLNYYFYKKTLRVLDILLKGGEEFQRSLCNIVVMKYFLPGEDIVREMDVVPWLNIVHRGSVLITQDGKELARMTKGCIFGQFEPGSMRPLRITARALDHTDILQLSLRDFHDVIDSEIRKRIAKHPTSFNDYMNTKKRYVETAYNTVQYILRGAKTIHLPFMKRAISIKDNRWYYRWLFFAWLVLPTIGVTLSMLMPVLPPGPRQKTLYALHITDFFRIMHFLSEFYTTKLVVKDEQCVHVYFYWKIFKNWRFYLDVLSLTIPITGNILGWWETNVVRVFRLYLFSDFYKHFCKDYRSRHTGIALNVTIIVLLFHSLTCGWIYVACRVYEVEDFPIPTIPMPSFINESIDYGEWVLPKDRRGGCPRLTKPNIKRDPNEIDQMWFVVPKEWYADYILSLSFVLVLHTHTNMDNTVALTISQIYYKVFMDLILYMAEMWISSITVSAVYTKYREMYQYSFNVSNLILYLKQHGLSISLVAGVVKYTKMLWRRDKGCWLPEITKQGSLCLQEDILCELYMYHLKTPSVFRKLPDYFLRQLAVRIRRKVIFPGKYIVQEGDIFPCIYFIHEGEVEKWYRASDGTNKMLSVLSMNGFFGLIPGLFPDLPFHFTYYSRTVVDLIVLRYADWQDLLMTYTDVRDTLYQNAHDLFEPIFSNVMYREQSLH